MSVWMFDNVDDTLLVILYSGLILDLEILIVFCMTAGAAAAAAAAGECHPPGSGNTPSTILPFNIIYSLSFWLNVPNVIQGGRAQRQSGGWGCPASHQGHRPSYLHRCGALLSCQLWLAHSNGKYQSVAQTTINTHSGNMHGASSQFSFYCNFPFAQ